MYTVLIEWDGNKPPTRFYERLHSFGIYARKRDENGNVYPNRGTEENLMVQEGAIVCQSFSSAQVIANLAKVCGALMTVVYEISETVISDVPKSVEDKFLTARKGKRKLEKQVTVTCLSCQETHHKFDIEFPVVCPVCASHRIQVVREVVSTTIDVPGNPTPIDLANLLYANGILVFPKNVFIDDFGLSKIPDAQPPQELIEACRMALYRFPTVQSAAIAAPKLFSLLTMSREERIMERVSFLQKYYLSGGKDVLDINPPDQGLDETDLAMVAFFSTVQVPKMELAR